MCALKLGSLFDGIGVFPLAASRNGIIPVWASEIEKSPIAITKRHFPDMEHLGDITKIHGGNIPPVHIITFGSPCQNLSKIGKREGLAGSKSGLFFQAIRIIEEMRCATNGLYPVIAVWENVMGAFSSNDRMDFRAVLQSFSDTEISMPPTGGWANAGMVRGGKTDLCWRLMDAQYWGKPRLVQRRKRIFLVADFRGQRSAEILFKPRDMFPIPPPCTDYGLPAAGASRISLDTPSMTMSCPLRLTNDDMKKRAFMLVGILLISIVMSACSSNSKSTTNENETTIIQAEYPVYDTAEEIVDASDLVFSGTVTEINYESLNVKSETGADSETGLVEATEIPYTIFDISIEKVYKGNVESSSISIKRPGGKIDGQFFVVEGTSTIEVGETYLFITQTYENAYPSLLNVTQASFDMSKPEVLNSEQGNAKITLSEVLEYLDSIN